MPGLNETESITDKRQLCIRAINAIHSIVDATHTKTLRLKNHDTIEDTRCKLIAIYNPLRHFSHLYLPGYEISNSHKTSSFSMNYREYHQRELYLLLNDIYWVFRTLNLNTYSIVLSTRNWICWPKYAQRRAKYFKSGP